MKPIHSLTAFAEQFRVHISRDECNDPIIQGKRGHLYFDGPKLCLMVLDGPVRKRNPLAESIWKGDISRDPVTRKGAQDVELKGIPPEAYKDAIRYAGCRPKRILSEQELEQKRAAIKHARSLIKPRPGTPESPADAPDDGDTP